ncbi:hypothetical protein QOZ80_1AG0003840 [Eleusine coracana subsp. coracana]|nr:hypothetical protein QOZ80_1AG0003840 [Eleusine coracana subsp. coracana]
MNLGAKEWLEEHMVEKSKWALAFDEFGWRYGIMTTNNSEVFNYVLKGVRGMRVAVIIRFIFHKLNTYFVDRWCKAQKAIDKGEVWGAAIAKTLLEHGNLSKNQDARLFNPRELVYDGDAPHPLFPLLDMKYDSKHRAHLMVDEGRMLHALRARLHKPMPWDDRLATYITPTGFLLLVRVASSGLPSMYGSALTTLIDRWRPETHTFHLPCGEATVTLEDVGMITALSIDGMPVTSSTQNAEGCKDIVEKWLGIRPPEPEPGKRESKTSSVKSKWLTKTFTLKLSKSCRRLAGKFSCMPSARDIAPSGAAPSGSCSRATSLATEGSSREATSSRGPRDSGHGGDGSEDDESDGDETQQEVLGSS